MGNLFIQGLNMGELFADEKAMMRLKPPLEGLFEQVTLRAHLPACEFGYHGRITLACQQGCQHLAGGSTHQVSCHRGEFDVGIFQDLLHAVDRAGAFLDDTGPIAGEFAHGSLPRGRHKTGSK
jgi:hypothetical protein